MTHHEILYFLKDIDKNIHETEERMENMFLKRIDELDSKLDLILMKLKR